MTAQISVALGALALTMAAVAAMAVVGYRQLRRELRSSIVQIEHHIDLARSDVRREIRLAGERVDFGLDSVCDSDDLNYSELLESSRRVVIVLNDGRTWVSVHREKLRRRIADPDKQTTVILIHPESAMIDVLARKGNTDAQALRARIAETIGMFETAITGAGHVEVLGHFLFNPHSLILTDDRAVTIPYFISRGGRAVPAFVYRDAGEGSHFAALWADVERLRMDCESLMLRRNQDHLRVVS